MKNKKNNQSLNLKIAILIIQLTNVSITLVTKILNLLILLHKHK